MKRLLYLVPLLFLAGYGCGTPHYDKLEEIPEYPQLPPTRIFDTSATIELTQDTNQNLNNAFEAAFRSNGYKDIVFATRFHNTDRKKTKIVSLLSFSNTTLYCEKGNFLETHLIVMVREPGFVWNNELCYTAPRYFQAYSQTALKGNYILEHVCLSEVKNAFRNLFTIEEFREALQPSVSTPESRPQTTVIPGAEECWQISLSFQSFGADWHEAARWALLALEKGNRNAADFFVEHCLFNNFVGDRQLYMATLKKCAELGTPAAQFEYARLFANGHEVPQDWSSAFFWMEKAALQNHSDAQYALGSYYEHGKGVVKNRYQAIFWYQKAAANSNKNAIERLKALGCIKD